MRPAAARDGSGGAEHDVVDPRRGQGCRRTRGGRQGRSRRHRERLHPQRHRRRPGAFRARRPGARRLRRGRDVGQRRHREPRGPAPPRPGRRGRAQRRREHAVHPGRHGLRHRRPAAAGDQELRGRHQRHPRADRDAAAGQPQLPAVRRPRPRRALHRQRRRGGAEVPQRRRRRAAGQRLRRRPVVQERRAAGRRLHAGQQPRQPVPAERRAGVPGPHPELQGGVREGGGGGDHRGDPLGRQRLPRRRLLPAPGQGHGDPGRLLEGPRRREAGLRAQAVGPRHRRPDRQGQAALLRLLRGSGAGPRRHGVSRQQLRAGAAERAAVPRPVRDRRADDAVRVRPLLRQGQLAVGAGARALRHLSPARRAGDPRLRRPAHARRRREHRDHHRRAGRQAPSGIRQLAQRGHPLLAAAGMEPDGARRLDAAPELLRHPRRRRQGRHAGLRAGPPRHPRRRLLLHGLARDARLQGRHRRGAARLRGHQVHLRERPLRVPQRRAVAVPVPGPRRLRRSHPRVRQHPGRPLPAGRLAGAAQPDAQPRGALGLRVEHDQQRLPHAARAGGGAAGRLPHLLAAGGRAKHLVHPRLPRPRPLHHRRQRPRRALRHVPAAPRLRLGRARQRQDGGLRRLGQVLRPRHPQRHLRRGVPAAVQDLLLLLLGRRHAGAQLRRAGAAVGPQLPLRRGAARSWWPAARRRARRSSWSTTT